MKWTKSLVSNLLCVMGACLSAESMACTPGQGPAGDPNCRGPIESSGWYGNNGGDSAPVYIPPTVITLPDSWGALAQSATTKAMGVASKQASKQASKLLALQNCASNGASDCKVLITYKNTCVAIAQNVATASYGHNPNISILREQLLKGCSDSSNGERCKIVYEECMP